MTKLIIGAGNTKQDGWRSLERSDLDARDWAQWQRVARPGTVDAVLSEHVLEHLYPQEALLVARNVYQMLRPGGYWRIAVPDANNPDPVYQDYCRPNGPGQRFMAAVAYAPGEPDHKVHYNLESLSRMLAQVGFQVLPLEWYSRQGVLQTPCPVRYEDGYIRRKAGDLYLLVNYLWAACWNTSLIVDAVKV